MIVLDWTGNEMEHTMLQAVDRNGINEVMQQKKVQTDTETDWQTDRDRDWMIDRLTGWLTGWLTVIWIDGQD